MNHISENKWLEKERKETEVLTYENTWKCDFYLVQHKTQMNDFNGLLKLQVTSSSIQDYRLTSILLLIQIFYIILIQCTYMRTHFTCLGWILSLNH